MPIPYNAPKLPLHFIPRKRISSPLIRSLLGLPMISIAEVIVPEIIGARRRHTVATNNNTTTNNGSNSKQQTEVIDIYKMN